MLTVSQHLQALRIKQAAQATDPGSAAMAAAAKVAPSAIPMPTLQFPKPEEKESGDSAQQEEAHKKELERKDKELAALRNNNQVMQVQMAHLKALAQLDKHREQVYKSIEKKEQDHRRHMEQEDFQLQQKKERMQAEEIKHKANIEVASAQQQASAAEAQAKMTAQTAQQNAQDYIKMTQNAQRDADNYFSQKHKDLDKRQKDLDAQQKALDAAGSRISPIVMNQLQNAVKATAGLGAIRSKLQGTPGISASSTMESLNKMAAADFESNTNYVIPDEIPQSTVLDKFRVTNNELQAWEAARRAQGVTEFWKRKGEIAKESGDTAGYEQALAKWREAENNRIATITKGMGITGGRIHAESSLPGVEGTDVLDTSRALTYLRAADTLRGRQNSGVDLTDEEKMNLAAYDQAYDRLKRHFEAVQKGPLYSEKDKMNAKAELALLDQYQKKHETGWFPWMKAESERDRILGPGQSRNFIEHTLNDSEPFGYAGEQWNRAGKAWDKGDYLNAARYGLKSVGGGVARMFVGLPLQAAGEMTGTEGTDTKERLLHQFMGPFGLPYQIQHASTYGTEAGWRDAKELASKFGVTIGQKGLEGGTPEARATVQKMLEQANLYSSGDAKDLSRIGHVGENTLLVGTAGVGGSWLKGLKHAPKLIAGGAKPAGKMLALPAPKQTLWQRAGKIGKGAVKHTWLPAGSIGAAIMGGTQGSGGDNINAVVDALTKRSTAVDQGPHANTAAGQQQGNRSDNLILQQDDNRLSSTWIGRMLPYISPVASMFGVHLGPGAAQGPRTQIDLASVYNAPEGRFMNYARSNQQGLTYEGNKLNAALTPSGMLTQQTQPNPWGGGDNAMV